MLVISTGAEEEANRLSDCCISIEPTPYLSMKVNITSIDGALLCDPLGICHAIGLILMEFMKLVMEKPFQEALVIIQQ